MKHVIICDDDPRAVSLLSTVIGKWSVRVSGATTISQLQEAISAQETKPIVLLDFCIGDQVVTAKLINDLRDKTEKVIVTTGWPLNELPVVQQWLDDKKITAYLQKSYDAVALSTLKRLITGVGTSL